jgi:5S rRNA maturation endonuclease (ribonuclease M5)
MRERLSFDVEGEIKKQILEALKNEQKYNKKIPVYDTNGEEIVKILKWDTYHTYIDFWLDNAIAEFATEKTGKIKEIILYNFTTSKGTKLLRIKEIVA